MSEKSRSIKSSVSHLLNNKRLMFLLFIAAASFLIWRFGEPTLRPNWIDLQNIILNVITVISIFIVIGIVSSLIVMPCRNGIAICEKHGRRATQFGISILAGTILIIHLLAPSFSVDAITISLLIIGIVPWLAPLIKSFELPGGLKVEFSEDAKKGVEDRAEESGLLSTPILGAEPQATNEEKRDRRLLERIADEDLRAALSVLRVEIEIALGRLAQLNGIDKLKPYGGVRDLLKQLNSANVLNESQTSVLLDLLSLLNLAVHGRYFSDSDGKWAMDVGCGILDTLENLVHEAESSKHTT
jgi:hypothetical protein